MGIFGRDEESPQAKSSQPPGKDEAKRAPQSTGGTVIARPTTIEGRVFGTGEMLVDGAVKGTIEGSAKIRIARDGIVEASVHGRTVSVAGKVTGDISADERIELEPTASVNGNITAPRILIQDGASFDGQVNMKDPAKSQPAQKSRTET
jgi:cytoskeletal protein CcmA (bactofilin family)